MSDRPTYTVTYEHPTFGRYSYEYATVHGHEQVYDAFRWVVANGYRLVALDNIAPDLADEIWAIWIAASLTA